MQKKGVFLIIAVLLCSSVFALDLSDYPDMFITGGSFDGLIVVGDNAPSMDVLSAIDITTGIQASTSSGTHIDVGSTVLASEIDNIYAQNLISVGGPCINQVTAKILGTTVCSAGIQEGQGYIKLIRNKGVYHLLIYGFSEDDTRRAAKVLNLHKTYPLTGDQMLIGGDYNDIRIQRTNIVLEPEIEVEEEPVIEPVKIEEVQFELFVMSKCPYAKQVKENINPLLKQMGDYIDFDLHYVVSKQNNQFQSLHGESEVNADRIEVCAREYEPEKYMDLIVCMDKDLQGKPITWEKCGSSLGIDFDMISDCYSYKSDALLDKEVELTKERNVAGSPTIFINGEQYAGDRSTESFRKAFCSRLSHQPLACFETKEPEPEVEIKKQDYEKEKPEIDIEAEEKMVELEKMHYDDYPVYEERGSSMTLLLLVLGLIIWLAAIVVVVVILHKKDKKK